MNLLREYIKTLLIEDFDIDANSFDQFDVERVVDDFESDTGYDHYSCDLNSADCVTVSNVFADWLENEWSEVGTGKVKNVQLLQVSGFKPSLGKDADPQWLGLLGDSAFEDGVPKPLVHSVVKVGGYIVDLTGIQLGAKYVEPVYTVSELSNAWEQISTSRRGSRVVNDFRRQMIAMNEAVVTGRKLDRYTTIIKRHVINAIKDKEVRDYFSQTGEVHFKLQNVPELKDIDYLRDVIIVIREGQSVNADAAYEFDLDASHEQRKTSDLRVNLVLPRGFANNVLSRVNDELTDAIRHELEHSGQETWELMDCQKKTPSADIIWKSLKNAGEYYLCPAEIKAHIAGFMKRAKCNRTPLGDIIDHELYRIYDTGRSAGYTDQELHDFMSNMRREYYAYAKQRYPRAKGLNK